MGKIYTIANRKGGVSKTTTTGALANRLSARGLRVLAIDMDPQGNLTNWNRYDTEGENTTYEVIMGKCSAAEAICKPGPYYLMPADAALADAESQLASDTYKQLRMKEALEPIKDSFDFIFLDTPPSLSSLVVNAFVASDGGVLVTTDTAPFSAQGMEELENNLEMIRKRDNPSARVIGILLTRFNSRLNIAKTMKKIAVGMGSIFNAPVYDTCIRTSVAIMDSQLNYEGEDDVFDSTKVCAAAVDYDALADEFLTREHYYQEVSSEDGSEEEKAE